MNKGLSKSSATNLLRAVQNGDRAAFEKLYELTSRDVFHYLCGFLKDSTAAEDVLIEVYLAVWRGASSFEGRSRVRTWIFGIARNLALNFLRKSPPMKSLEDHPEVASPRDSRAASDRRILANEALAAVSPHHREVLELVFLYGFSYQEIAGLLDIPVNTVKTRVFHAKKSARQYIEGAANKK